MTLPSWFWLIIIGFAAGACSSQRYLTLSLRQAEKEFKNHIGFVLYDPVQRKTMCDYRGDRYFTPASNTKIFTLYASLVLLGDSIPSLRYSARGDSLIFWGTGAPGFLYKYIPQDNRVFNFLKNHPSKLFFSSDNFKTEYFGPGWAWDDYNDDDQVARTSFPIYGNRATVQKSGEEFTSIPPVFECTTVPAFDPGENPLMVRQINGNKLTYTPGKTSRRTKWTIPFHYSDELLRKLLSDTLKRDVQLISRKLDADTKTLNAGVPDSLYKVMMQVSDNFIAEQLLLLVANVLSDTLKPEIAINFMKKKFLKDVQADLVWVDGSGLSRYNLFTPQSIVWLWNKIYERVPRERLFSLLPAGGRSGTLRNSYKADPPFIYGKTGSLRHNHVLSGYLVTKRGRTLIFSWMNNNFTASGADLRARMETVLKKIYEKY